MKHIADRNLKVHIPIDISLPSCYIPVLNAPKYVGRIGIIIRAYVLARVTKNLYIGLSMECVRLMGYVKKN